MKYKKMLKELDNGKTISRTLWDNLRTVTLNKDDITLLTLGRIDELSGEHKNIIRLDNYNSFIAKLPVNIEINKSKAHTREVPTIEKSSLETQDDGIDDWFVV